MRIGRFWMPIRVETPDGVIHDTTIPVPTFTVTGASYAEELPAKEPKMRWIIRGEETHITFNAGDGQPKGAWFKSADLVALAKKIEERNDDR